MRGTQFAYKNEKYRHFVPSDQFSCGYKRSICKQATTWPTMHEEEVARGGYLFGDSCSDKPACPMCVAELKLIAETKRASLERSQHRLDMALEDVEIFKKGVLE